MTDLRFAVAAAGLTAACATPQPTPDPKPKPAAQTVAVTKSEPPPPPKDSVVTPDSSTFEAVVRIDPQPGAKRFQGVWLESKDGERLLVAYRARPWWKPFEGRTVEATGQRYRPPEEQQQLLVEHFRVERLQVLNPTAADRLVSIGGELQLTGEFRDKVWPAGSKLDKSRVFTGADGTDYFLGNAIDDAPEVGVRVTIKARPVELSPFAAHPGGPHLWVVEVAQP